MKITFVGKIAALGIWFLTFPAAAHDESEPAYLELPSDWTGFYLGGGPTYANVYSWTDEADYGDADYGDGDIGYTLNAGYRFNPWLASRTVVFRYR